MSVSLYWMPIAKSKNDFESYYNSDHASKIRDIFHSKLNRNDIPKLIAFFELSGDELWSELAEIVEKVGAIEVLDSY